MKRPSPSESRPDKAIDIKVSDVLRFDQNFHMTELVKGIGVK